MFSSEFRALAEVRGHKTGESYNFKKKCILVLASEGAAPHAKFVK